MSHGQCFYTGVVNHAGVMLSMYERMDWNSQVCLHMHRCHVLFFELQNNSDLIPNILCWYLCLLLASSTVHLEFMLHVYTNVDGAMMPFMHVFL